MATSEKNFINYFKNNIFYNGYNIDNDKNESDILMVINIKKRYYERICLVEGIQDVVFYGNIDLKVLNNALILYATNNKDNKQLIGKQNVLNSYLLIRNNDVLNRNMNKYIFIVDHDYDGIDYYQPERYGKYEVFPEKEKKNITVTKGYSFENYFMTKENINTIFEVISKEKNFDKNTELVKYKEKYEEFISDEIIEFFSWVACIVYGYRNNYFVKYQSFIKIEEIFNYNFSIKEVYNKELLKRGIEERKKFLYANKTNLANEKFNELKKIQRSYYIMIKEKSYIQGHTIYNFLNEYFKYYFDVDLGVYKDNTQLIKSILPKLDIKVDIKLANGKTII